MPRQFPGPVTSVTGYPRVSLSDFEEARIQVAERRYEAKDTIFVPGDPDKQLYFVLSGAVRLYKIYSEYKEATIAILKDGDVFGELSLEEGLWQTVFAHALSEVRLAVVRKSVLVEAMKRDPELAMKLFSSFSERLKQSDEVIGSLLDREVSARLATLLQNLSKRFGQPNGSGTILEVRLTHQELANMVASTREAVSKVMSEFRRDGLITVHKRKIVISPLLAGDALAGSSVIPGAA